jgi:hypothetical protein
MFHVPILRLNYIQIVRKAVVQDIFEFPQTKCCAEDQRVLWQVHLAEQLQESRLEAVHVAALLALRPSASHEQDEELRIDLTRSGQVDVLPQRFQLLTNIINVSMNLLGMIINISMFMLWSDLNGTRGSSW